MTITTPAPGAGATSSDTPLLTLRGVTKSFGAVEVLRDVDLDVRLGREMTSGSFLSDNAMERRAVETLAGLSVRTVKSVRQKVASLSGGQRQTVAIARSVLWNSKLVILDEPTAALGVAQTEQVLNLVRRLADNGLAVILISHNMNDVLAVADDIAVLYLGKMATQVSAKDVTHGQVVELITAGRLSSDPPPIVKALEEDLPIATSVPEGEGI